MARWSRGRIAIGVGIAVLLIAAVVGLGLVRSGAFRSAAPAPASPSIQTTSAPPPSPTIQTTAPPSVPPPQPSAEPQPEPSAQPPAPPPAGLPVSLRGLDLERIPTSQRVVALTFDAGANNAGLQSILSTLATNRVPGTFFLTGAWVNQYPDGVAAIINGGHRIGNHSMTHPSFTTLTDAQIAAQISSAEETIQAAGADPRPFFRFPSGARNDRTIADVNTAGYVAIRWTVDTLGWQGTVNGTRGPAFVTQRVMAAAQPGEIVLMHLGANPDDGSTLDAAALPQIIAQLRAAGYGFVTLDAVLG